MSNAKVGISLNVPQEYFIWAYFIWLYKLKLTVFNVAWCMIVTHAFVSMSPYLMAILANSILN